MSDKIEQNLIYELKVANDAYDKVISNIHDNDDEYHLAYNNLFNALRALTNYRRDKREQL